MTTITLTVLGSRGITVDVGPSCFEEAPDGVAISYALCDGPLTFTITADEAQQLATAITDQLAFNRAHPEAWPRPLVNTPQVGR